MNSHSWASFNSETEGRPVHKTEEEKENLIFPLSRVSPPSPFQARVEGFLPHYPTPTKMSSTHAFNIPGYLLQNREVCSFDWDAFVWLP